eukprot:2250-Heterococcus_DN1.PRE.2
MLPMIVLVLRNRQQHSSYRCIGCTTAHTSPVPVCLGSSWLASVAECSVVTAAVPVYKHIAPVSAEPSKAAHNAHAALVSCHQDNGTHAAACLEHDKASPRAGRCSMHKRSDYKPFTKQGITK